MDKLSPVGVFDSGVGGFSVVREMQKVLPGEDVVYYGDTANMPYGNRSGEEILHLTRQILAFLERRGVKAAAVACNTISALIDRYRDEYPFKIFSVIEAGAASAAALDCDCAGVPAGLPEGDRRTLLRFYKCVFAGVALDWLDGGMDYDAGAFVRRAAVLLQKTPAPHGPPRKDGEAP